MSELRLEGIAFRYPGAQQTAVRDINLQVKEGEFVTILGSSGSGKTTVLRMIGGYLTPTLGRIAVGDRDVTNIPPQKRNIGTVFQNYALFPHMSVFDNVAFGLKARRLPKAEVRQRALEALATVRLQDFGARMPSELSGGQQQRVALARAISIRPSVLLLDEPLGALDARLRESVQVEIKRVQRSLGITTISVTHDQNEAFSMSDRIVLMRDGDIVSVGTPEDLYLDPKTAYSAEFVGHAAVLPVEVTSWGHGGGRVRLAGGTAEFEVSGSPPDADKDAFLVVRPEAIELCDHAIDGRTVPGTVLARRYTGFDVLLTIDIGAGRLVAVDPEQRYREEDVVNVYWEPSAARILQG